MDDKLLKPMRSEAEEILKSSLEAVNTYRAVNRFVLVKANRLILGIEDQGINAADFLDDNEAYHFLKNKRSSYHRSHQNQCYGRTAYLSPMRISFPSIVGQGRALSFQRSCNHPRLPLPPV